MVFRVWSRVLIFAILSSSECPLSGPETATWRRLTWGQQVSSVPGGGMKPLEEEEEGCGDRGGEDDGNMNTHWTQLGETWIEDRSKGRISMWQFCLDISTCRYSYCQITPQAPDRFNPKVSAQTCGIIQKLYETRHIETMTFGKSVMGHFSKIEPKTSK